MKYDAALQAVLDRCPTLPTETIPLMAAHLRALSEDVTAPCALPAFDNSAMDGYALRASDTGDGARLLVVGEVAAGHAPQVTVGPGQAVRIFTGATVPPGADAVVRQERVRRDGDTIELLDTLTPGADVRATGSDIAQGQRVLTRGVTLDPGRLALLAGLGIAEVPVVRRPRLLLLATGSEVIAPGGALSPGQVWDANTVALSAQAREAGAEVHCLDPVSDQPESIATALAAAMEGQDVVVTTAGVSVGDYDHVHEAFERLGVETVFWRLAIRPGKPVRFGFRGKTLFLGLPGNPLAAQTTFEVLVRPALMTMLGLDAQRPAVTARLTAPFPKRRNITYFNRGSLGVGRTGFTITPTSRHGSGMLGPSAEAGALLHVPHAAQELPAGAPLRVDILRPDAIPTPQAPPAILAVCAGGSNSGKTLWVCALVAALTRRGLRVGTVKHTHKDFDVPGKDSAQHRDAGAKRVILSANNGRSVLVPEPETSLEDLVATDLGDMDLVIAEGFRSAGAEIPKLFVGEPERATHLQNIVGFLRRANAPIGAEEGDAAADRLLGLLEAQPSTPAADEQCADDDCCGPEDS
jgi:molybdopterin molybdotransferase